MEKNGQSISGAKTMDRGQHLAMRKESKLLKESHVRFDEYLELNEESMRRSCRRLMSHLYSNCDLPGQQNWPKEPGDQNRTVESSEDEKETEPERNEKRPISSVQSQSKSYLRSQYERRQQRQSNMLGKMEDGGTNKPNSSGANNCRHQQDLVVKSHELSKRRFFEKLERGEFLRNNPESNLTFNPRLISQSPVQHLKASPLASQNGVISATIHGDSNQSSQQEASKEYKRNLCEMRRISKPAASETATAKLIALQDSISNLSQQRSQNVSNESSSAGKRNPIMDSPLQSRLLEFLNGNQSWNTDESEFEIRVPETLDSSVFSSDSLEQNPARNQLQASGLLVVKQVSSNDSPNLEADLNGPTRTDIESERAQVTSLEVDLSCLVNKTQPSEIIGYQVNKDSGKSTGIHDAALNTEALNRTNNDSPGSPRLLIGGQDQKANAVSRTTWGIKSTISYHMDNNSPMKVRRIASTASLDELMCSTTSGLANVDFHEQRFRQRSSSLANRCTQGTARIGKPGEAPEISDLVGQRRGGDVEMPITARDAREVFIATETQAQSKNKTQLLGSFESPRIAALVQQVASNSLAATKITKQQIRDSTREATEINRIETVVSAERMFTSQADAAKCEQVNQLDRAKSDSSEGQITGLASPSQKSMANEVINVDYDETGPTFHFKVDPDPSKAKIEQVRERITIELLKGDAVMAQASALMSHEDDRASSCSSSGFGAGSSDGCTVGSNANDGKCPTTGKYLKVDQLHRAPVSGMRESLCTSRSTHDEPDCAEYGQFFGSGPASKSSKEDKTRVLLIENQSYATVTNFNFASRSASESSAVQRSLENVDYANLNHCDFHRRSSQTVNYASLGSPNQRHMRLGVGAKNDGSEGEVSISTSESGISGGFSALPPPRVQLPSPANICDSTNEPLSQFKPTKKCSILRRFGSLVSKAFGTQITTENSTEHEELEAKYGSTKNHEKSPRIQACADVIIHSKKAQHKDEDFGSLKDEQESSRLLARKSGLVVSLDRNVNLRSLQARTRLSTRRRGRIDDSSSRDRDSRNLRRVRCSSCSASSSSSLSTVSQSHPRSAHQSKYAAPIKAQPELSGLRSGGPSPQKGSKSQPSRGRSIDIDWVSDNTEATKKNSRESSNKLAKSRLQSTREIRRLITLSSNTSLRRDDFQRDRSTQKGSAPEIRIYEQNQPKYELDVSSSSDSDVSWLHYKLDSRVRASRVSSPIALRSGRSRRDSHHSSNRRVRHHHKHSHRNEQPNSSCNRHARSTSRCAQTCRSQERRLMVRPNQDRAKGGACGQLISINENDGSQVIELKRPAERPWGFFVAKGAINNAKG